MHYIWIEAEAIAMWLLFLIARGMIAFQINCPPINCICLYKSQKLFTIYSCVIDYFILFYFSFLTNLVHPSRQEDQEQLLTPDTTFCHKYCLFELSHVSQKANFTRNVIWGQIDELSN